MSDYERSLLREHVRDALDLSWEVRDDQIIAEIQRLKKLASQNLYGRERET